MAQGRKKIPPTTITQLMSDQANTCCICQKEQDVHVHHIIEHSQTQDHSYDNLVLLCPNCHSRVHTEKGHTKRYPAQLVKALRDAWIEKVRDRHRLTDPIPLPKSLTDPIPKMNPRDLVGRAQALEDLRRGLAAEQRMLVVNGMGGIGKTSLAMAYVFRHWEDYQHILWLTVDKPLEQVMAEQSTLLNHLGIQPEGLKPDELLQLVLRKLETVPQPRLLVLDNATQDLERHREILPSAPDWHVLLTSREDLVGYRRYALDFLTEEDAYQLYLHYWEREPHKNQKEEILELIRSVEYHTLTLEILAKTARRPGQTLAALLTALHDNARAGVPTGHSQQEKITRVTEYLRQIFTLQDLPERELWLLQNFACLPPDYHSFALLMELLCPEEADQEEMSDLLTSLRQKGWLLQDDSGDIKLHRIVAEVVLQDVEDLEAQVNPLIDALLSNLEYDISTYNPIDKRRWLPFGERILQLASFLSEYLLIQFQNGLGVLLLHLGFYDQARILLEASLASELKTAGPKHSTVATTHSNLGIVYRNLGEYVKARELLEAALASDLNTFGPDHPKVANRQSNLGNVYRNLGEYEKAREMLKAALASDLKTFGPDHPMVANRQSNLANVYAALKEYGKARELLEVALSSALKIFGPNHPAVATVKINLGNVYENLGEYGLARDLLETALVVDTRIYGKNHATLCITYIRLSYLVWELGERETALAHGHKALHIAQTQLPEGHPNIEKIQKRVDWMEQELGKGPAHP